MRFAAITATPTPASSRLADACPAGVEGMVLTPQEALRHLRAGDVAVGRLDVLETLDGIADGLWCLGALEARGVRVLNPASVLLASHDKLITARLLAAAGVPHPRTQHVLEGDPELRWRGPVVVKPRFGSWGRDVSRCTSAASLAARRDIISTSPWFMAHGALVQELVPPVGHDLRLVVAGGRVVGAVRRVCAPGEWRTNVALGARRETTRPPRAARALALAAAAAVGADLVGVDLLPTPDGRFTVLELNGAVEFNDDYGGGRPIFPRTIRALLAAAGRPRPGSLDRRTNVGVR